ncbi:MAG: hypothetical protein Q4A81_07650 [Pasteurellaceae bacterium]|nr:hypothetical protein [Pasteurellaceae bacterium]
MTKDINEIKNQLISNAIISIQIGVEDYTQSIQDSKRTISSIRNITSGLLLTYKYYLLLNGSKEDPFILISAEKNRKPSCLPKKTVNVLQIIDRLSQLKVTIEKDRIHNRTNARNMIEHFFNYAKVDINSVIYDSFILFTDFYSNYLETILGNLKERLGENVYNTLMKNKLVLEQRKNFCNKTFPTLELNYPNDDIEDEIFTNGFCSECSSILLKYHSGVYPDLSIECDYCGHIQDIYEIFGITHHSILNGDGPTECYECGFFSCINGICFECGYSHDEDRDYESERNILRLMEKND